jgi:uncharacterized phage infection (PIP) family protein YhgE
MSGNRKFSEVVATISARVKKLKSDTDTKLGAMKEKYDEAISISTTKVVSQQSEINDLLAELEAEISDIESTLDTNVNTATTTLTDTETKISGSD